MSAILDPGLAVATAYVDEVRTLCRQAGCPEAATGLIESQLPIDAVNEFALRVAIGFRSRHRQGLALAPFKDLFLGHEGKHYREAE